MLIFTGDICLSDKAFDVGFGMGSQLLRGTFSPFSKLLHREEDVWIGNFESVLSDHTTQTGYHQYSFRISPSTFNSSGSIIDYWGIANNHVMGHGSEAYQQMEDKLQETSSGVFGSEGKKSVVFSHQGKVIAITGFSLRKEESNNVPLYWHLPEMCDLQNESEKIKDADFKVAYVHWGVEYVDHPSLDQVKLAHWLIDTCRYDLIVGMHPHVLQGYEVYQGKYIFYSLGNFIFNMAYSASKYSAVVTCDPLTGKVAYQYVGLGNRGCPRIMNECDVPNAFKFDTLNRKITNEKNIEKYVREHLRGLKAYRKSNNMYIIRNLHNYKPSFLLGILLNYIKRKLNHAH